MNTQSKSKILILVIGILLLANIVLLSVFLINRPGKKQERKSNMPAYLKKDLGFNETQMARFDSVKTVHRQQVKVLFDRMRAEKATMFRHLGQRSFSDSAIEEAASYAAGQQREIELHMLGHLKEIRDICTPEQRAKFDTGFYKVMLRTKETSKTGDKK